MNKWRPYLPHALGAAAGLCLIGFGVQWWQHRSVARELVHARSTALAAAQHDDSVSRVNAAQTGRIIALTRSAEQADSTAALWRRRALANERALAQFATTRDQLRDSLRLSTTGADSLPVLVRLVNTLTSETTALRQSLGAALFADSMRKHAVDSLTTGHLADSARYELVVVSNKQLRAALTDAQRALARAEAPCRILFFKCPTRTSVAVVGGAVGAGVTYLLTAKGG